MILPEIMHFLPLGSTVAVQRVGGDRWTHGTIVGKRVYIYNNWSHIIWVTRTRTIARNGRHINATSITAVQYLCNQLDKHKKIRPHRRIPETIWKNKTVKQVPIMDNYVTPLIETLHKTSNKKGHITISEDHRVKEFQKTILILITETEMIKMTMTQGCSIED